MREKKSPAEIARVLGAEHVGQLTEAQAIERLRGEKSHNLGQHEVLDRAHLLQYTWERFIVDHRVVRANPELRLAADRLNEQLAAFYQLVGRLGD